MYVDAMVDFKSLLKPPQDGDGILYIRFAYQHLLEPALKRRIFFNIFSMLVKCSGTNAVQFSSCKHRLQHIPCIHCPFGLPRPYNRVEFINEEENPALTFFHFIQYRFQPFFKLAPEFGPCNKGTHIE
ncbi:Protein of uncharacterised function (DUF3170) [Mycobacteroides abscessus subsp. abscessus]|nr:Protein of uncharacterised function (DUF3170) [Mycobacteroides abscessus subsp. abscessus]